MVDSVLATLQSGLKAILNLLPDSPFAVLTEMAAQGEFAEWLGFLNWFIPVYSFIAILQGWLLCVGLYYIYQIVFRWIKAIE